MVFLGEDVGAAGGVFKATRRPARRVRPARVRDTPISEQAILGAAMGAAMTGLRPIAEIMFADFFAVCWDIVANEIAKSRYMTDGQVSFPLVIRSGNGGGLRFGAQHSQSVENWAMAIPGLKVVAPSNPADVIGLFAAAVRDPDPVLFFEHKCLYSSKGEVPDGEIVDTLGRAKVLRDGRRRHHRGAGGDGATRASPPRSDLQQRASSATVVDVRSLVPLDTQTILRGGRADRPAVHRRGEPAAVGWGAEIVSIVAEECFWKLDGPIVRITTPHIPLPSADALEDLAIPSVDRIVDTIEKAMTS